MICRYSINIFIGNRLRHACTTAALTSKGYSSSGDHRQPKCANVCWQIFMNVFKRKTKHYHQNVHGNSKIYQLFTLLLVISQIHFHQGPWDTRQKRWWRLKRTKSILILNRFQFYWMTRLCITILCSLWKLPSPCRSLPVGCCKLRQVDARKISSRPMF